MKNKTLLFILIVCIISWIASAVFYLLGGDMQDISGIAFCTGLMFIPLLSVIITQFIFHEPILKNLGISFQFNRWFVVAALLPIAINLVALAGSAAFPSMHFSTETPILQNALEKMSEQIPGINAYGLLGISLLSGLFSSLTINAVVAFGEEIAWRGWLLKQFEGVSFLKAALVIGVIWGIWHAPIILMGHNYPQHPAAGAAMMVLFCIMITPVMQYIRIKAHSMIPAAIFHGAINAGVGLSMMYIDGFNDLLGGLLGVAGFITLLIVNLILFAIDKWVTKENIYTEQIKQL